MIPDGPATCHAARVADAAIFVLDSDALLLESIVRAVEPLGKVQGACVWTDVAGPMLHVVRDLARPVVLVCDLDGAGGRNADFCRVVRQHAPRVRVVVFSSAAWGVPEALSDVVVSKSAGVDALARAVASAIQAGAHRA